jgi:Type I site-specific restriction-modification system, R (restriction) subunit and related helicases
MSNEADTCRKYVVPNLTQAGWDHQPHFIAEQRTFTDGRIMVAGNKVKRRKPKRADYLLTPLLITDFKMRYTTIKSSTTRLSLYNE